MRKMMRLFCYFFLVSAVFFACKSQRISSSIPSKTDTALAADVYPVIDTLRLVQSIDSITLAAVMAAAPKYDTVTIIGVGDIMLGTNFPKEQYLPANRGKDLLAGVSEILSGADLTFGNHEGVILNDGGDQKKCNNPDVCYLFRSPGYLAGNLKAAGFDVMSLANNHAGDFGDPGRLNTMRVLDSLGIEYAGLIQKPYTSFERGGIKYGFVAFAPNAGTVSIHNYDRARKIVAHLDSLNDIVIVSFHGGAEGKDYQHVTRENEIYYGEERGNVYLFAHEMVNAGADIIFGHGPHVSRAIEVYNERFIAYSLGNFCTYARFNLRGPNGVAPIAKLYTDKKGKFLKGKIISIKQIGAGIPKLDDEQNALKIIRDLTKTDFPESKISIDDKGIIKYIHSEI